MVGVNGHPMAQARRRANKRNADEPAATSPVDDDSGPRDDDVLARWLAEKLPPVLWQNRAWFSVGAVLVFAAALRWYRLGVESIWLDEAFTLYNTETLKDAWAFSKKDVHPPGYYFLFAIWRGLAGTSEAAIRALSALWGVVAVAATYGVGRRLGGHRVGLYAAALLALSHFAILQSQNARSYAMLAATAALSMHAYLLLDEKRTWRNAVYYVASTLLLLHVHFTAVFVVMVQGAHRVVVLWPQRDRSSWQWWGGSLGAVGLLFLPWALVLWQQTRRVAQDGFWVPEPAWNHVMDTLHVFAGSKTYVVALAVIQDTHGVIFPLAILLIVNAMVASRLGGINAAVNPNHTAGDHPYPLGRVLLMVGWALVPVLAVYLLSKWMTPIYLHRILIVSLPAFLVLVGWGLARISLRWARWALLLLLVVPTVSPLQAYYADDQREQWREAVALVEERAAPGALVVMHGGSGWMMYDYYGSRNDVDVHRAWVLDEAGLELLRGKLANADDVWFVLNRQKPEIFSFMAEEVAQTHRFEPLGANQDPGEDLFGYAARFIEISVFQAQRPQS